MIARCLLNFILLTAVNSASSLEEGEEYRLLPVDSNQIAVLKGKEYYFEIKHQTFGPSWSWLPVKGSVEENFDNGFTATNRSTIKKNGAVIEIQSAVTPFDERRFVVDEAVSSSIATPLTAVLTTVEVNPDLFSRGSIELKSADGDTMTLPLPINKVGSLFDKKPIKTFTLFDNEGLATLFSLSDPKPLAVDKVLRIPLAADRLEEGEKRRGELIVTLPSLYTATKESRDLYGEALEETKNWYPFDSKIKASRKSVIDMSDWLETPAGKHGRIKRAGDKLIYNNKEIKLWGINLLFHDVAPKKAVARERADFYAKYGINAVRLHQFGDGPGWRGIKREGSSLLFDGEKLDRFDYFVSQLKERGIYIEISLNFGITVGIDDAHLVPYLDEFKAAYGTTDKGQSVVTKHGSIYLSEELQNLQIANLRSLLEHKNPYTGLTYAEEPAVAFVEMFNEDSALFFGTMNQIKKIPTLKKRAGLLFTEWLAKKYGTKEALENVWGAHAINAFKGEVGGAPQSFEEGTILPIGNPWFYEAGNLEGPLKRFKERLLDTMLFLYDLQNSFYKKTFDALRSAGYDGEVISSNWVAGSGVSHYLNLHSDSLYGNIDRHNYYGGRRDKRIVNSSLLSNPGSAFLSSGLQQVADRTFTLSEWNHVFPTEWAAEGPAIISSYGMGLQGWDASFIFQNSDAAAMNDHFTGLLQVDRPTAIGLFPAVARQVHRGDVKESKLIIPLYVELEGLKEGKIDFKESSIESGDLKSYDTDKVPFQALAVGRVLTYFTDKRLSTPPFDPKSHMVDGYYVSSTGELKWKPGSNGLDGHFTIDTAGTKGVIGFAKGVVSKLGNITIESKSRFAAIYLSALGKNSTIENDSRLLITAIARVRQKGMAVFRDLYLLEKGHAPFIMEPVVATISLKRGDGSLPSAVYRLDHGGARTDTPLPLSKEGVVEIDTGKERTPYFEVVYPSP